MKIYCGIDVHKESFVGCMMNEQGSVIRLNKFTPDQKEIEKFITGIKPEEIIIAIEACGLWMAAYKILIKSYLKICVND